MEFIFNVAKERSDDFLNADMPSRLMILMAIRIRLPLGTGLAPTVGVGVCLLVLHSRTAA